MSFETCIFELAEALDLPRAFKSTLIYHSRAEPSRCVFKVCIGDQTLAMKYDSFDDSRSRFEAEYNRLCELEAISKRCAGPAVVSPIFLSEKKACMFTKFCRGLPLGVTIENTSSVGELVTLYENLGSWFRSLHNTGETVHENLRPGWLLKEVHTALKMRGPVADEMRDEHLILRTISYLKKKKKELRGKGTMYAVQHGDVTAKNFLVKDQSIVGLDLGLPIMRPVSVEFARLLNVVREAYRIQEAAWHQEFEGPVLEALERGYGTALDHAEIRYFKTGLTLRKYINSSPFDRQRSTFQEQRFARLFECLRKFDFDEVPVS